MKDGEGKIILASLLASLTAFSAIVGFEYYKEDTKKRELAAYNKRDAVMQQYGASGIDYKASMKFEPGTHYVMETFVEDENSDINTFLKNMPEGYEVFDHSFNKENGKYYHKFIFVNNVEVVAEGVYNPETCEVIFATPGTPVESQELTLNK